MQEGLVEDGGGVRARAWKPQRSGTRYLAAVLAPIPAELDLPGDVLAIVGTPGDLRCFALQSDGVLAADYVGEKLGRGTRFGQEDAYRITELLGRETHLPDARYGRGVEELKELRAALRGSPCAVV